MLRKTKVIKMGIKNLKILSNKKLTLDILILSTVRKKRNTTVLKERSDYWRFILTLAYHY